MLARRTSASRYPDLDPQNGTCVITTCTIVLITSGSIMLVTIDTSIVMAVLLEEQSKKAIVAQTQGAQLQAPPSLLWEVGNALSSLMRRKILTSHEASSAIAVFERIPIRFAEIELGSVVELLARHSMWAYDAYVVECAKKYRTPLMTLDKDQSRIAVEEGVEIIEVSL